MNSYFFDAPVDYNSPPPYDPPPGYPGPPLLSFFTLFPQLSNIYISPPPEYDVQDDPNFVTQINEHPTQNTRTIEYMPLEETLCQNDIIHRHIKEIKDKVTAIKNVVEELKMIPKNRHDLIDTNK
ncbi:hypothetical protein F8M41_014956 [Gigaspora margarita]|uniref:Uncharacterized protein n=1 Tax=Gigaspora margarita TaxID=4874 RepID=A0A8H4AR41_GIGMA|nr:hypothetical protein F8M41_014956 [Gigaspora margarita]